MNLKEFFSSGWIVYTIVYNPRNFTKYMYDIIFEIFFNKNILLSKLLYGISIIHSLIFSTLQSHIKRLYLNVWVVL